MSEEKKKDIFELLLSGEKITEEISTLRGKFIMNYPLPRDLRAIEIRVAEMLSGQPEFSFPPQQLSNFRAYATLDNVISSGPDWYEEMESWEDCPDDELVVELYRRYLQLYKKIQKRIQATGVRGKPGGTKRGDEAETVGD